MLFAGAPPLVLSVKPVEQGPVFVELIHKLPVPLIVKLLTAVEVILSCRQCAFPVILGYVPAVGITTVCVAVGTVPKLQLEAF